MWELLGLEVLHDSVLRGAVWVSRDYCLESPVFQAAGALDVEVEDGQAQAALLLHCLMARVHFFPL